MSDVAFEAKDSESAAGTTRKAEKWDAGETFVATNRAAEPVKSYMICTT